MAAVSAVPERRPVPRAERSKRGRVGIALALLLGVMAFTYRGIFASEVVAGRDVLRLFIPDAHFLLECLRRHVLPLWNPAVRFGQPFAATLQSQAFYPPNVLAVLLVGPVWTPTVLHLFNVAVAGSGLFFVARKLRCTFWASCVAAAIFALTPFFFQAAFIPNITCATAWTGWIAGLALDGAEWRSAPAAFRAACWLALPIALSALCGAPVVTLVQCLIASALCARGRWRGMVVACGGMLWAFLLAAPELVPALELVRHSVRHFRGGSPLAWSTSAIQLVSVFVPFADLPRGPQWGADQWLFISLFLGATGFVLALLGVSSRRGRLFGVGALVFALLCMGAHFPPAGWLLSHPPLSIFRYPAKYFVGTAFCVAVLAALGFDRLGAFARRWSGSPRRALWALVGGLAVLFVGVPALAHFSHRPALPLGFAWTIGVVLLLGLAFFLVPDGVMRPARVRAICGALLLCECLGMAVWAPPTDWIPSRGLSTPSPFAQAIPRQGRVSVSLPFPPLKGAAALAYMEAARKNWAAPMLPTLDGFSVAQGYGTPEPAWAGPFDGRVPRSLYDLVGVSAFIRESAPPFEGLERVSGTPKLSVLFRSTTALPRAFVVYRAKRVNAKALTAALADPKEPFRTTVFLEDTAGPALLGGAPGCVGPTPAKVTEGIDRVRVDATSCAPGYLVLTDADYPGWRATVDGKPAPILRADGFVRAVRVPKGPHQIVMEYRPWSFRWGLIACLLGLLGCVVVSVSGRLGRHPPDAR